MTSLYADCAVAVLLFMTAAFAVSLVRRDNSVVDFAWGPGFVLIAAIGLVRAGSPGFRQIWAAVLTAVWALRLTAYLAVRSRGRGEDFRYAEWRRRWGRWFIPRSYAQVFLLQGALMLVIALPIVTIMASPRRSPGAWDAVGTAVWLAGVLTETTADAQLRAFLRDSSHRGRVMSWGLWRFSRHPNYFGEALTWWGLGLAALSGPRSGIALAGPLLLTLMLRFVSGVPMLEKRNAAKPGYLEYARRTSIFVPWPPKR